MARGQTLQLAAVPAAQPCKRMKFVNCPRERRRSARLILVAYKTALARWRCKSGIVSAETCARAGLLRTLLVLSASAAAAPLLCAGAESVVCGTRGGALVVSSWWPSAKVPLVRAAQPCRQEGRRGCNVAAALTRGIMTEVFSRGNGLAYEWIHAPLPRILRLRGGDADSTLWSHAGDTGEGEGRDELIASSTRASLPPQETGDDEQSGDAANTFSFRSLAAARRRRRSEADKRMRVAEDGDADAQQKRERCGVDASLTDEGMSLDFSTEAGGGGAGEWGTASAGREGAGVSHESSLARARETYSHTLGESTFNTMESVLQRYGSDSVAQVLVCVCMSCVCVCVCVWCVCVCVCVDGCVCVCSDSVAQVCVMRVLVCVCVCVRRVCGRGVSMEARW